MFDIHCHILPNVDDGAADMQDSIEMACVAAKNGTVGIAATPHCNVPAVFNNYQSDSLKNTLSSLKSKLVECGISLGIFSGQEVFLSDSFEDRLKNGDFITLNGSRYMLVEFDFEIKEKSALSKLECLVSHGYVPIVAHPERYGFVVENPFSIKKIHLSGGLIQLNGGSFFGHFGRKATEVANFAVSNRLADFVASDAHSQFVRTPDLSGAYEFICTEYSYDYADLLLTANPLNAIEDKTI